MRVILVGIALVACASSGNSQPDIKDSASASVSAEPLDCQILSELFVSEGRLWAIDLAFAIDEFLIVQPQSVVRPCTDDSGALDFVNADKFYKNQHNKGEFIFIDSVLKSRTDLSEDQRRMVRCTLNSDIMRRDRFDLTKIGYALTVRSRFDEDYNPLGYSNFVWNLLVINGCVVVGSVKPDRVALKAYKEWLFELKTQGITSIGAPMGILERQRHYILERYSDCNDSLMRETLEVVRFVEIKAIQ